MDVTSPTALRALAHPLRLDLIELLGAIGPMTAAECGRRLGASQASCSFHLRQLAKYGFVTEAASDDGRERPWALTDIEQRWSSDDSTAPEFERLFVQREMERILGWSSRRASEPKRWRDASLLGGMTLPLTPADLKSVRDRLREVLDPYIGRIGEPDTWPRDARLVRVLLSATPLTEKGTTDADR